MGITTPAYVQPVQQLGARAAASTPTSAATSPAARRAAADRAPAARNPDRSAATSSSRIPEPPCSGRRAIRQLSDDCTAGRVRPAYVARPGAWAATARPHRADSRQVPIDHVERKLGHPPGNHRFGFVVPAFGEAVDLHRTDDRQPVLRQIAPQRCLATLYLLLPENHSGARPDLVTHHRSR